MIQVNLIISGLTDLKNEIKKMSEDEEIENPDKIVNLVKKILDFNEQNQEGQGLKILTPYQMLSRIPITLPQSQEGSNSEKLKYGIKQLLYSFVSLKKIDYINIWIIINI